MGAELNSLGRSLSIILGHWIAGAEKSHSGSNKVLTTESPEVSRVFGFGRNHSRQLQNHSSCSYAGLARGVFLGGGKTQSWEKGRELESREGVLSLAARCLKPTQRGDLLSSFSPAVPGLRQVTSGHVFNIV